MAYELNKEPDPELATRKGEFAMLIYSIGNHSALYLRVVLIPLQLVWRQALSFHTLQLVIDDLWVRKATWTRMQKFRAFGPWYATGGLKQLGRGKHSNYLLCRFSCETSGPVLFCFSAF